MNTAPRSNWAGTVSCTPDAIWTVSSEEALKSSLARIRPRAGRCVRPVGAGHSFDALCASDDIQLSLSARADSIAIDAAAGEATFWAGSGLAQVAQALLDAGLALDGLGDIDAQRLGGAIATGTHGAGRAVAGLAAQVTGFRLVTASGEAIDCTRESAPEIFHAGRLSLGALGVMSTISLRVAPAHRLHERHDLVPFEQCLAELTSYFADNRHAEFFWIPGEDVCLRRSRNRTDKHQAPGSEVRQASASWLGSFTPPDRVDWACRIFATSPERRFVEQEFAVPETCGPDCMRELRALLKDRYAAIAWPVQYRPQAADDIPLSPAFEQPSVTLSVHADLDGPWPQMFRDTRAIFRNHRGRPHWGKLHGLEAGELSQLFPGWADFTAVRERLDPDGLFLNDRLRRLLLT